MMTSQGKQRNVQEIMEFEFNQRQEMGVKLYLNKTIRPNEVSQLMLPSLFRLMMRGQGLFKNFQTFLETLCK